MQDLQARAVSAVVLLHERKGMDECLLAIAGHQALVFHQPPIPFHSLGLSYAGSYFSIQNLLPPCHEEHADLDERSHCCVLVSLSGHENNTDHNPISKIGFIPRMSDNTWY